MKFKPKLRVEHELEFTSLMGRIKKIIENEQLFPFRNCLNCTNFTEKTELCKLFNAKPPARVIAYGCERHDDVDQIPF